MLGFLLLLPAILLGIARFLFNFGAGKCNSKRRLDGKVAIVTGASAGIGLETARDLARRGAKVILACRNIEKAQRVADDIINSTQNKQVIVKKLDTSSLSSVRAFAKDFLGSEKQLHILVNNAGMVSTKKKQLSEDGFELSMATNHYGHFLLTNMLGGALKAGAPSRIVNVSSLAHLDVRKMDTDDLNYKNLADYKPMTAYALSKLCNVMIAKELANRLRGTGVTAYSLHPGIIYTEIFGKTDDTGLSLMRWLIPFTGKSAESGAQTQIFCAVDESVEHDSGLYYADCKEAKWNKLVKQDDLVRQLWTASERDVNLQPDEAKI